MTCTSFSLENLPESPMKPQQIIAHNLMGGRDTWCVETGMQNVSLACGTASPSGGSECVTEQNELGLWLGSQYAMFHESVYLL